MNIKTRVKKLEEKAGGGLKVVVPEVWFFDAEGQFLEESSDMRWRPSDQDKFRDQARSASAEIEGLEPIVVKLEKDEDSSLLSGRIDVACQEAYRASGLGGICLSWWVPFI